MICDGTMLLVGLALGVALTYVPGGCAMELTRAETDATCELDTCGRMRSVTKVSTGGIAAPDAGAFCKVLRLTPCV